MTFRILFVAMLLSAAACHRTQPIVVRPTTPAPPVEKQPSWPGVDRTVAKAADSLADKALVSTDHRAESTHAVATARAMVHLADSLLGKTVPGSVGKDSVDATARDAATAAYNKGAAAVTAYAADTLRADSLLTEATAHFKRALHFNPYDEDARYWLSRVYTTQAEALDRDGAHKNAVSVLEQLVALQGHRADYVALLAQAHENVGTYLAAGALWQRAAENKIDDAVLTPQSPDSAAVFTYYARSSRAYAQHMQSDLALTTLDTAAQWVTQKADADYVHAERAWLLWDNGNLHTRQSYDTLVSQSVDEPERGIEALVQLLSEVRSAGARLDVEREIALLQYRTGSHEAAVARLQSVLSSLELIDTNRTARVREDYGVMTYNLGMDLRGAGDLRAALAYLMQSEQSGFSRWPLAALQISKLLSNNIQASMAAALRAEQELDRLSDDNRKELLLHLVELHRRSGDRAQAQDYTRQYHELRRAIDL